jgi:hypothetical protein
VTFLGDPGAGKSIFVRIVIARVIDGTPPPGVSTELLPVLIALRDLVQRLVSIGLDALPGDRHAVALATAVRDQIIADLTGLEAEGFDAELREALNAHRCLLVFDDLDEVPQEWRGLVQRAVVTVINHYQPHQVSVTCRTRSYLGDATLPGFNAFTLTPLDAKQFASFASAWYNTQRELGRVDAVQARQKGTNLARVLSGWGEPIWRRGLERQCLGMDAESEESLSLPGGPARAGTARKSSGASQQSPCAAGRGVQRPPRGRAVCLSGLGQPGPPVQVPRLSGGGVPMPLVLRALFLWSLGKL